VPQTFPSESFLNLVYLELAMCQISSLPPALSTLIPNCRILNLNYNFLSDIEPLKGLTRLRRMSLLGSRVTKYKALASVLATMPELELLDLR
jgi:Leucine-rich repeat (LRR) protein